MTTSETIDALRSGAELWQSAPDPALQKLGDALEAWIADGGSTRLDHRLGLALPGQRAVTTLAALAQRDRLIVEAAREYFPNLKPARQAAHLSQRLTMYRAGRWRRGDGAATQCPINLVSTVYSYCWRALKYRDTDLSPRHVRRILATSSNSWPTNIVNAADED